MTETPLRMVSRMILAALMALAAAHPAAAVWWVQQEAVEPEEAFEYEQACQEFFRSVHSNLPLEIFALRDESSTYTYLVAAPESSIATVERLNGERLRNLVHQGLKMPAVGHELTLLELPEVSRQPVAVDEALSFFQLDLYLATPERQDNLLGVFEQLALLREDQGLSFKVLGSSGEVDPVVLAVVEAARDRRDLRSRKRLAAQLLGKRGRRLGLALAAEGLTAESIEGELVPALSYPGRGSLIGALWPDAAVEVESSEVDLTEAVEGDGPSAEAAPPSGGTRVVPLEPLPAPVEKGGAENRMLMEPLAEKPSLDASRVVPLEPLASPSVPEPEVIVPRLPEDRDAAQNNERRTLEQTVNAWAAAWSEQRVADYLGFYGQTFQPANGKGRERWRDERRVRLSRPSNIVVSLEELQVRLDGSRRAWVEFIQTYHSESFSDRVRKLLEMRFEDGAWKIVEEQVVAELGVP